MVLVVLPEQSAVQLHGLIENGFLYFFVKPHNLALETLLAALKDDLDLALAD